MKKGIIFLCILLLCLPINVLAYGVQSYLSDEAQLLNDAEAAKLESLLAAASDEWNIDIAVHTTDSLNGKSAMHYADDYYDSCGYGEDGVLLIVSMAEREWWISTAGKCMDLMDADSLGDRFTMDLSTGHYYDAFTAFLDGCEAAMEAGNGSAGTDKLQPAIPLVLCVLIGTVIGLIVVLVMKGQLKSVRAQAAADSYVRSGSLQLHRSTDLFLYQNTARRPKPQNNNRSGGGFHVSSSGRRHGGGGGRF